MTSGGRHLAVLFADLERHTDAWQRVRRERMVTSIAEYRYIAESLAGQYGCLYREWAGDGHMFLFESPDAAVRFALRLIESWSIARAELPALRDLPDLPLRLGCHFGECTRLEGEEAWIGRGNAIAKRVEAEADPNSLFVTEGLLDLLDLPLYEFEPVARQSLKGDALPERALFRIVSFDHAAAEQRPDKELTAEAWFLRGVALFGTEREWSDDEADCYREALGLKPDYPEAHVNLGVVLRARSNDAAAAQHYRDALALRQDYPEAHYNYAVLLAARGSASGAAEHYREALRLRPDYVHAHHAYANLLTSRGELEEAAEHYTRALELRPDDPEAHVDYAILLEQAGDADAAASHYRAALELRADPAAHYNFALLLESRGDTAAAESHYREALRLWPDYGEAHNNLAVLLQLRGDTDESERHYLAALRARPDDPEAHYNYGLLLRTRGDEDAAARHFRTAYELAPDVPTFRSALERPV